MPTKTVPLSVVFVFLAFSLGCAKSPHVEVDLGVDSSIQLPPIDSLVVDDRALNFVVGPFDDTKGFRSVTFDTAVTRAQQGARWGALPGALLHGGTSAKGEALAILLALAGASTGAIAGTTVGLVEGGAQDIMAMIRGMRANGYPPENVYAAVEALHTGEILTAKLEESMKQTLTQGAAVLNPDRADLKPTNANMLLVTPVQIGFITTPNGSNRRYGLTLTVTAERTLEGRVEWPSHIMKKFVYRGDGRGLSEWTRGGPDLLIEEHVHACQEIADAVKAHFVSRPSPWKGLR